MRRLLAAVAVTAYVLLAPATTVAGAAVKLAITGAGRVVVEPSDST